MFKISHISHTIILLLLLFLLTLLLRHSDSDIQNEHIPLNTVIKQKK